MTDTYAPTAKLLEALKPFLEVEEATHEGPYRYEMSDDEYISIYYHDIRVKHFRALKEALND